jgi:hypothetical protein
VESASIDAALKATNGNMTAAARAVGELVEGLMCILEADLPVMCPLRNEERHFDAIENTVQMHSLRLVHEVLHIRRSKHPPDVAPIVSRSARATSPVNSDRGRMAATRSSRASDIGTSVSGQRLLEVRAFTALRQQR